MNGKNRTVVPMDAGMPDQVMDIWLEQNLRAHPFVPAAYWHGHADDVREHLPGADVWVFLHNGDVWGFAGLVNSYIAGIFVAAHAQGKGVGRALLDHCKARHDKLELHVYRQNAGAIAFYLRCGFTERGSAPNADTGHEELHMVWEKAASLHGEHL